MFLCLVAKALDLQGGLLSPATILTASQSIYPSH